MVLPVCVVEKVEEAKVVEYDFDDFDYLVEEEDEETRAIYNAIAKEEDEEEAKARAAYKAELDAQYEAELKEQEEEEAKTAAMEELFAEAEEWVEAEDWAEVVECRHIDLIEL
jgi:hypothetical protein